MIVRRTLDGALKCALRDFLREEWRAEKIVSLESTSPTIRHRSRSRFQLRRYSM